MVVWFAHVRVGHRQTLIAKCPLRLRGRGFFFGLKKRGTDFKSVPGWSPVVPGSRAGDGFQIRPLVKSVPDW